MNRAELEALDDHALALTAKGSLRAMAVLVDRFRDTGSHAGLVVKFLQGYKVAASANPRHWVDHPDVRRRLLLHTVRGVRAWDPARGMSLTSYLYTFHWRKIGTLLGKLADEEARGAFGHQMKAKEILGRNLTPEDVRDAKVAAEELCSAYDLPDCYGNTEEDYDFHMLIATLLRAGLVGSLQWEHPPELAEKLFAVAKRHLWDRVSITDVARELGITRETASRRMSEARERMLKTAWRVHLDSEDDKKCVQMAMTFLGREPA